MHDNTKPSQIIGEQRIERQSINVRLSSPLPASVSMMLGAAVTASTTTLTTIVMTTALTPRAGGTPEEESEGGRERERERERDRQ